MTWIRTGVRHEILRIASIVEHSAGVRGWNGHSQHTHPVLIHAASAVRISPRCLQAWRSRQQLAETVDSVVDEKIGDLICSYHRWNLLWIEFFVGVELVKSKLKR